MEKEYNAEQRHQEICNYIHKNLYLPKNAAYGDSFHKLYSELGIISAVTQISHKYNRLVNLAKHKNENIKTADNESIINTFESITDTLLDLANYCILTAMEIEKEPIYINNKESR